VASYIVDFKKSAAKELSDLPAKDVARIVARIQALAMDPRPQGSEKLSGNDKYRVRQGDYRVLYAVSDANRTVTIVKIAHRREVYRR
jgi:mRNA interferase RelE/StbE